MKVRRWWWARVLLIVIAGLVVTWYAAPAQNFLSQVVAPPLPDVPPNGAWGEVIMANNKWLVVQNHQKQQFPIAIDPAHIKQFLVRWPISARDLTNDSLVEAVGPDLGSNTVQVDHVDVFMGADQTLVTPAARRTLPNNRPVTAIDPTYTRLMSPWDLEGQSMLYGWAFPTQPGTVGIPERLHVVGNVLALNPLQLGVLGNNVVTVVPGASGEFTMTQVTYGTASFLQKGDLVFLDPVDIEPKSMVLQQLVLYKKIPRSQFAP